MQFYVLDSLVNSQHTLIDQETGYLLAGHDIDDAELKIIKLYRDALVREKMGEKGRIFVKENFDIEILNKRLVNFYKRILGKK